MRFHSSCRTNSLMLEIFHISNLLMYEEEFPITLKYSVSRQGIDETLRKMGFLFLCQYYWTYFKLSKNFYMTIFKESKMDI